MPAKVLEELRVMLDDEYVPDCYQLQEKMETLVALIEENGPGARKQAIDANGYKIAIDAWTLFCDTGEDNIKILTNEATVVREAVLVVLAALTPGHPKIIDRTTFEIIFQAFDGNVPETTKIGALKVMRNICINSETNRETLTTEWKIIPRFVEIIKVDEPSIEFIRQWCGALRALTLNDDRTVAYNRSAERQRFIFQLDGIYYLAAFLIRYQDETILNSLVVVITMMASHEPYCVAIHSAGAIGGLEKILQNYPENDRLITSTIRCIRYICVSGIVRESIGNTYLVKHTLEAANRMMEKPENLEVVMACLAYLTMGTPCSCAQFLSERGVPTTLDIMKKHMEDPEVLKGCCLILKNVASLSGHVGTLNILEAGGDILLRQAMKIHAELAENHVKPALGALGFEGATDYPGTNYVPDQLNPEVQERLAADGCGRQ